MEHMILSRENLESVAQFIASRGGRVTRNDGGGLSVASETGHPDGDEWRELPLGSCVRVERVKVDTDDGQVVMARVQVTEEPPENKPDDQQFNVQAVADGKTT